MASQRMSASLERLIYSARDARTATHALSDRRALAPPGSRGVT